MKSREISDCRDMTPQGGWLFSVLHNLSSDLTPPDADEQEKILGTRTAYLGTHALQEAVRRQSKASENQPPFVEICTFPATALKDSEENTLRFYKEEIRSLLDQAKKSGKHLILGFSVWQGQQVIEVQELMAFVRAESEGSAVCLVGGPALHERDSLLEQRLFDAGADILNIGGAGEIAAWIAALTAEKKLARDQNGLLMAACPEGAPFFTAREQHAHHAKGSAIPVPPLYLSRLHQFNLFLPGSGCPNQCGFCSIGDHAHRPVKGDLRLLIEETKALLLEQKAKQGPDQIETTLGIANPNPLETPQLLFSFLKEMPANAFSAVSLFGNALSFCRPPAVDPNFAYFDFLLSSDKVLYASMTLSLDAIQLLNDGDFTRRKLGKRLISSDEYTALRKNFFLFLKRVVAAPWAARADLQLNTLVHPQMTPAEYRQKFKFLQDSAAMAPGVVKEITMPVVIPYAGTEIEELNRGHFAPQSFMEDGWPFGYEASPAAFSLWGNQFKNGDLLDCYAVSRFLWQERRLQDSSFEAIMQFWEKENNPKEKKPLSPRLDKTPFLASLLGLFFKKTTQHFSLESFASLERLYIASHWINKRETYLVKHEAPYAQNTACHSLIDFTQGLMDAVSSIMRSPDFPPEKRKKFFLEKTPS